jgi:hypothetical protein
MICGRKCEGVLFRPLICRNRLLHREQTNRWRFWGLYWKSRDWLYRVLKRERDRICLVNRVVGIWRFRWQLQSNRRERSLGEWGWLSDWAGRNKAWICGSMGPRTECRDIGCCLKDQWKNGGQFRRFNRKSRTELPPCFPPFSINLQESLFYDFQILFYPKSSCSQLA